jgi:hypothetical protein
MWPAIIIAAVVILFICRLAAESRRKARLVAAIKQDPAAALLVGFSKPLVHAADRSDESYMPPLGDPHGLLDLLD